MKQLILEVNFSPKKKFSLHLHNTEWLLFKSQIFVKKWLKTYKSLINDNVKILNLTASNINALYRSFYFEIDDLTSYKVVEQLNDVNTRFDFIFKQFSQGNQNALVFQNIELIFQKLIDVSLYLKDYSQTHKNYSLKHQVNSHIKLLASLEREYYKDKLSLNLEVDYRNKRVLKVVPSKQNVS